MIKGMGKKTTRRVVVKSSTDALLQKVLSLCVEISTTTRADVFFDYVPVGGSISFRVYPDGFDTTAPAVKMYFFDITERDLLAAIDKLEAMREELRV